MDPLSKAILRTMTWFDVIGYPVTSWEVFKFLLSEQQEKFSPEDVSEALQKLESQGQLSCQEGFYFLPGRTQLVRDRKERYLLAERKFRKAKRVIRILRFIPWIKMVSVCNTLGYSNAPEDSDIDLFIVVQHDKLWTARFFVIGFLKFFGLRPLLNRFGSYPEVRRDRIDANFFISDQRLSIENLAIEDDIYLAYWLVLQTPIYDPHGIYGRLLSDNDWLQQWLPNLIANRPCYRRRLLQPSSLLASLLKLLNPGEKICQKIQEKIMPRDIKDLANRGTGVVINDSMLKFHDQDKRAHFRDLWLKGLPI